MSVWWMRMIVIGEPCFWWELQENCVNTSGPESIKWWHHQCVSHNVITSPMSVQSESSIYWEAFPTSWIFIKNSLVTSSLFAFQINIFILLGCFTQLFQIQRLAKYHQCIPFDRKLTETLFKILCFGGICSNQNFKESSRIIYFKILVFYSVYKG